MSYLRADQAGREGRGTDRAAEPNNKAYGFSVRVGQAGVMKEEERRGEEPAGGDVPGAKGEEETPADGMESWRWKEFIKKFGGDLPALDAALGGLDFNLKEMEGTLRRDDGRVMEAGEEETQIARGVPGASAGLQDLCKHESTEVGTLFEETGDQRRALPLEPMPEGRVAKVFREVSVQNAQADTTTTYRTDDFVYVATRYYDPTMPPHVCKIDHFLSWDNAEGKECKAVVLKRYLRADSPGASGAFLGAPPYAPPERLPSEVYETSWHSIRRVEDMLGHASVVLGAGKHNSFLVRTTPSSSDLHVCRYSYDHLSGRLEPLQGARGVEDEAAENNETVMALELTGAAAEAEAEDHRVVEAGNGVMLSGQESPRLCREFGAEPATASKTAKREREGEPGTSEGKRSGTGGALLRVAGVGCSQESPKRANRHSRGAREVRRVSHSKGHCLGTVVLHVLQEFGPQGMHQDEILAMIQREGLWDFSKEKYPTDCIGRACKDLSNSLQRLDHKTFALKPTKHQSLHKRPKMDAGGTSPGSSEDRYQPAVRTSPVAKSPDAAWRFAASRRGGLQAAAREVLQGAGPRGLHVKEIQHEIEERGLWDLSEKQLPRACIGTACAMALDMTKLAPCVYALNKFLPPSLGASHGQMDLQSVDNTARSLDKAIADEPMEVEPLAEFDSEPDDSGSVEPAAWETQTQTGTGGEEENPVELWFEGADLIRGEALVGWKVAVNCFMSKVPPQESSRSRHSRQGGQVRVPTVCPPFVDFGVVATGRWSEKPGGGLMLKIVYDDLSHDWFHASTVETLVAAGRIVLVEDCASASYASRSSKERPHEAGRWVHHTPVGRDCVGKSVRVWSEVDNAFYSGRCDEWLADTYIRTVSPRKEDAAWVSGLLRVVYNHDGSFEWLSEESDRLVWWKEEEEGVAAAEVAVEGQGRVGWGVVYVPEHDSSGGGVEGSRGEAIKGYCIGSATGGKVKIRRTKMSSDSDSKETLDLVVPAGNCAWLSGVIDNREACESLVDTSVSVFRKGNRRGGAARGLISAETIEVTGFEPDSQTSTVLQDRGDGSMREGSIRLCWEVLDRRGGEGNKSPHFFGASPLAECRNGDARGLRVLRFDLNTSHVQEGVVLRTLPGRDEHEVLFTDCTTGRISEGEDVFEFCGEAGVFEVDRRCRVPLRIPIYCGNTRATFWVARQLVAHEGRVITPAQFEQECGMAEAKKWRTSLKILQERRAVDMRRGNPSKDVEGRRNHQVLWTNFSNVLTLGEVLEMVHTDTSGATLALDPSVKKAVKNGAWKLLEGTSRWRTAGYSATWLGKRNSVFK